MIVGRGLSALKFFFAAAVLGPEKFGELALAVICLAIAETLTETGLAQALIRQPQHPSKAELGAVWLLQIGRGVVVGALLALLSYPFSSFLPTKTASNTVLLAGFVAIARSFVCPSLALLQREAKFRSLFFLDVGIGVLDVAIGVVLLMRFESAGAVLVGTICAEVARSAISWAAFRISLDVRLKFKGINSYSGYAKWIWRTSIVTVVLNQVDKLLVARFIGLTELGLYQLSARAAQLLISDPAAAVSTFLFQRWARLHAKSASNAFVAYKETLRIAVRTLVVVVLFVWSCSVPLSSHVSPTWTGAIPLFRVAVLQMAVGTVIVLAVTYCRAVGVPRVVMVGTSIQLIVFVIFAPFLAWKLGAIGVIIASTVAGSVCAAFLLRQSFALHL